MPRNWCSALRLRWNDPAPALGSEGGFLMRTTRDSPVTIWLVLVFGLLAVAVGAALGFSLALGPSQLVVLAAVAALALALLTIVRIEFGLLLLVFVSYVRFSDVMIIFHGFPSTAKPLVALLAGALLIRWLVYHEFPKGWRLPLLLIGLYLGFSYLSLFYARNQATTLTAVADLLDDAIIAMLIVLLLQRKENISLVAWTLISVGAFLGTISVFQYITGAYGNNFWGFAQASLSNIAGETSGYRISGPFGDPNFYAQVMVVLVPIAFDRLVNARRLVLRMLSGYTLMVVVLTIIFTFSRGGFLALLVVSSITIVRYRPSVETVLGSLVVIAALLAFLPANYTDRINTLGSFLPGAPATDPKKEVSFRGRLNEYAVGLLMFADNPVIGVGYKNYPSYYLEYSPRVGIDPRRQERAPHSLYIEILAEQGMIGMIIFSLVLGYAFRAAIRSSRLFVVMNQPDYAGMASAIIVGMIGYLTFAVFIHGAFPRPFWVLVAIMFGLYNAAHREFEARRVHSSEPMRAYLAVEE
jgi:putative inorganic carbon (hco3(-)) transporter